MTINVERDFELVTLGITGRLDTTTAPNLESVINELSKDTKELIFDMSGVEYISSAGIRILLGAYKKMKSSKGKIRIEKANDLVREVFEMTGLSEMLDKSKFCDILKGGTGTWFGQLMTGPQVIAYLIQLETWLNEYNVKLDI